MSRRTARRLYRTLLRLFPLDFREIRGAEMERVVQDMCAEWEEEGRGLGLHFWASLVWDTSVEALSEWFSLSREVIGSVLAPNIGTHMSALMGDVRYALRQLVRQPLYSGMIVALMALGIAGNAAVFRVFNGLFLRPLPFENPHELVDLNETAPQWNLEYLNIAYRDYTAWLEGNRTFQSMAVYTEGGGNLVGEGAPQRVEYLRATHTIDEVLGLTPTLGRFFGPEEDHPDGPRATVLSQGFWEQQYGSDPTVIGRSVRLDGVSVEIIGILPAQADFMADVDMWLPLRAVDTEFEGWNLSGIGRLTPSATIEQARSDLLMIHKGLVESREVNEISFPVIDSLRDRYLGDYRLGGGFMLGAVAIVLLIACANIAGLMTARSMSRGPEMAVRLAMGAPRVRIVRQLLTEGFVLAAIGATVGAGLGIWGSSAIIAPLAEQFPSFVNFDLDFRFLGFTLGVTVISAVLFGLVPAIQASTARSASVTNRSTATNRQRRGMSLLVTGEGRDGPGLARCGGTQHA